MKRKKKKEKKPKRGTVNLKCSCVFSESWYFVCALAFGRNSKLAELEDNWTGSFFLSMHISNLGTDEAS
jgi:hypothetical protein